MSKLFYKIFLISIIFISTFYKSQIVTVRGVVKDSLNINNFISISVNDTINKFRDKVFKDETFKNKNWNKYDELVKKFSTFPDYPDGNYNITAKLTDTLYFHKRDYITQKYKVADIINKNIKVILKPRPCIPYKKCDQKVPSRLYAFVGKKIDVSYVDQSKYCGISLDSEYKAEYEIEQELNEHYPNSKIIFTAYDHNSMYEYDFSNYDNVLLFIEEYCDELVKDHFFPVYKTTDGRWASPIKLRDEHYYNSDKFKPININFEKSVSFDLLTTNSNPSEEQIAQLKQFKFPEKYYKIENGKAIPIAGRYVEDLVELWKEISEKNKTK
ncbi:hypothetical protein SAMN05421841_1136 [Chryseobacterium wanjuense]|uniref:Uncharacterized protein n=1 Tax=Chryseobacterium wanjuense TaxID=356305 RepID=A0A1I0PCN2_9FLAO|nr:hypothetical protein [Chryseobacterium wanjuense]SEW11951.1 hypothetical protein SAMN05421841_1136 [Chryseobacterium wanjuense]